MIKEPAQKFFKLTIIPELSTRISNIKKKLADVLKNTATTMQDGGNLGSTLTKTPLLMLQQNLNVSLPKNINSILNTVIDIIGNKLPQDLINIATNLQK